MANEKINGEPTIDVGWAEPLPAKVVIHLLEDGTVKIENGRAAAIWGLRHGIHIKIEVG